jgi:hypothetical protein
MVARRPSTTVFTLMPRYFPVRTDSPSLFLRRALESWPYIFIAVSVSGLSYIAVQALR